jgi:phosphonate degradation associated HDIG domain protein
VFAIYLADAIGYTGSIGLPLVKDHFFASVDRLAFFRVFTYIVSLGGLGILAPSCIYFYRKHQHPPETAMPHEHPVAFLLRLFKDRGDAAYLGEPVSQTEHALQTAWAAEQAGAGSSLIVAALLHDVGHLLHDLPQNCAETGIDDAHEILGARWLEEHFGREIAELVRLHVEAKRFLCSIDPAYLGALSEASLRSLQLQGGPLMSDEASRFRKHPQAEAAVALRHFDDQAKVPGLPTPALEHFRPYLETACVARRR